MIGGSASESISSAGDNVSNADPDSFPAVQLIICCFMNHNQASSIEETQHVDLLVKAHPTSVDAQPLTVDRANHLKVAEVKIML
eukprot:11564242-Ditylum_brightwellii.AAC.1